MTTLVGQTKAKKLVESGLLALTQTFGASGRCVFHRGDEGQRATGNGQRATGNGHQPLDEETPGNPAPRCNSTGRNVVDFSSPRFFGSTQVEMPEANTETDSPELIWHSFWHFICPQHSTSDSSKTEPEHKGCRNHRKPMIILSSQDHLCPHNAIRPHHFYGHFIHTWSCFPGWALDQGKLCN